MTSAYLCAESGISPAVIENQAAYIAGWLKKLRDDKSMVVFAAAQAQKAADYILGPDKGLGRRGDGTRGSINGDFLYLRDRCGVHSATSNARYLL